MSQELWIVDKQLSFREGLQFLLQQHLEHLEVQTFSSVEQLPFHNSSQVALVIIEPFLQNHLLRYVQQLKQCHIPTAFITMEQEKERLLFYLGMHMEGYLMKDMSTNDLIRVIDSLLQGGRYLHPHLGSMLLDSTYTTLIQK
ncbi:response regulator transcription factor [Gracilibacillus sp. YIM 98692]|uniref:response regulator transcription factor n=1 Tax=Gracilibacillus sp. YIM 98692 TaxID=2663532 RepID=UPI0013D54965|nr:response regulator transcription factor [Gracilibacillus sp. YIM 98692]